jgi:hypothetical protein
MTVLNHTSDLWAQERRQYRLIFGVAFVVLVTITLFARLLPSRLRPWPPVADPRMSIIAEARAVTHRVLPFAFL